MQTLEQFILVMDALFCKNELKVSAELGEITAGRDFQMPVTL